MAKRETQNMTMVMLQPGRRAKWWWQKAIPRA
jgi:hypothetical protein